MAKRTKTHPATNRKRTRIPPTRQTREPYPRKGDLEKREDGNLYWPEDRELPGAYYKRPPLPCPKCRIVVKSAGQAVRVRSLGTPTQENRERLAVKLRKTVGSIAVVVCSNCGETSQLPVRDAQ